MLRSEKVTKEMTPQDVITLLHDALAEGWQLVQAEGSKLSFYLKAPPARDDGLRGGLHAMLKD